MSPMRRGTQGSKAGGLGCAPELCRTLMRSPVVKRQTTPVSGFFSFFSAFFRPALSLGNMS
jgi:hypothetical protein